MTQSILFGPDQQYKCIDHPLEALLTNPNCNIKFDPRSSQTLPLYVPAHVPCHVVLSVFLLTWVTQFHVEPSTDTITASLGNFSLEADNYRSL